MTLDIVNIIAVLSLLGIVWLFYLILVDIRSRQKKHTSEDPVGDVSDYKRILAATHWLEHERQRNQGEHFDDEDVFLNRANTIRLKTSFFDFVNE